MEYLGRLAAVAAEERTEDDGQRDSKMTSLSHLSVWPREAMEDIYVCILAIGRSRKAGYSPEGGLSADLYDNMRSIRPSGGFLVSMHRDMPHYIPQRRPSP